MRYSVNWTNQISDISWHIGIIDDHCDHLVPLKKNGTNPDLFSGIPLCRALHPDHPGPLSFPALSLRWSERWVVAGLSKTGMDQLVVHGNSQSLRQIIWRNENSKGIYIVSITHRASKVFWAEKNIRSVGTSALCWSTNNPQRLLTNQQ